MEGAADPAFELRRYRMMGPGYICVSGPPSCGKTCIVQQELTNPGIALSSQPQRHEKRSRHPRSNKTATRRGLSRGGRSESSSTSSSSSSATESDESSDANTDGEESDTSEEEEEEEEEREAEAPPLTYARPNVIPISCNTLALLIQQQRVRYRLLMNLVARCLKLRATCWRNGGERNISNRKRRMGDEDDHSEDERREEEEGREEAEFKVGGGGHSTSETSAAMQRQFDLLLHNPNHHSFHHHFHQHHHHNSKANDASSTSSPPSSSSAMATYSFRGLVGFLQHVCAQMQEHSEELHLLLDDADELAPDSPIIAEISLWYAQSRHPPNLFIWIVSQRCVVLSSCYRYCYVPAPNARTMLQWTVASIVQEQQHQRGTLFSVSRSNVTSSPSSPSASSSSSFLNRRSASYCVLHLMRYFATNAPMKFSHIARDYCKLLKRCVAIASRVVTSHASFTNSSGKGKLTNIEIVRLWHEQDRIDNNEKAVKKPTSANANEEGKEKKAACAVPPVSTTSSAALDRVSVLLSTVPPCARVLLLACFYCGVVHHIRDSSVFSVSSGANTARHRRGQRGITFNRDLRQTAMFAPEANPFSQQRLAMVYEQLCTMVRQDDDTSTAVASSSPFSPFPSYKCFFPSAREVMHHLFAFQAWRLIVPQPSNYKVYRCHLGTEEACSLGEELGIDVSQLIPVIHTK